MTNVWISVQPLCCVCWSLELRWGLLTSVTEAPQRAAGCCRSSRLCCTFNSCIIKVLCCVVLWGSSPRPTLVLLLSPLPVPAASSGATSNRSYSTSCCLLLSFINSTTMSAQILMWFWSSLRFPRRPAPKQINISRRRGPDRQQGKLRGCQPSKVSLFRDVSKRHGGCRDRWRATREMRAF